MPDILKSLLEYVERICRVRDFPGQFSLRDSSNLSKNQQDTRNFDSTPAPTIKLQIPNDNQFSILMMSRFSIKNWEKLSKNNNYINH